MPYLRKLESGLWQATVRLPNGKRTTRTDKLKRVVADWARDLETSVARGEWRDPRRARLRWDEWRDRWLAARVVEPETARNDRSVFATHISPQWEGWRMGAITRIEVQAWIKRMTAAGVGAQTVRRAVITMTTMMAAAVDEGLILETPCRRLDLPATPPGLPQWFTPQQVNAICAELPAQHAAAVQLMAWAGPRWGEVAGLVVDEVLWLRRRVRIVRTRDQYGEPKDYPKSHASRREVPVPPHVVELLAPIAADRAPGDLLFRTVRQMKDGHKPWSGANWRKRWYIAVDDAIAKEAASAEKEMRAPLVIPRYSPHALRHTAASWLVQDGVPLYDVGRMLGHSSPGITARYAHLAPDAHGAVEAAWERIATHQRRIADVWQPGTVP